MTLACDVMCKQTFFCLIDVEKVNFLLCMVRFFKNLLSRTKTVISENIITAVPKLSSAHQVLFFPKILIPFPGFKGCP